MAKKPKSRWSLDSIKIYLTNDKGDDEFTPSKLNQPKEKA
jgi:hypothetical protein